MHFILSGSLQPQTGSYSSMQASANLDSGVQRIFSPSLSSFALLKSERRKAPSKIVATITAFNISDFISF